MVQAYERLATQWAEDRKYSVVKDDQAGSSPSQHMTVWVFGTAEIGSLTDQALPPGVSMTVNRWLIAGTAYDPSQQSVVITATHLDHPDQTVNWLIASHSHWVPVIARKLRHYGKYSYLVFTADAVVDNRIWPTAPSPMRQVIPWE